MSETKKVKITPIIKRRNNAIVNAEDKDNYSIVVNATALDTDTVDIPTIKERCSSDSYYRSVHSIINKINKHYGWNKDQLPIRKYENNINNIIKFIMDTYTIHNREGLAAKLSAITFPLKIHGYNGPLLNIKDELKNITYKPRETDTKTQDRNEIVEILNNNIENSRHPGGKIVAMVYKHGYMITLSDIINTKVDLREPNRNFLDLSNGMWSIAPDISKNKPGKQFKISEECLKDISAFIRVGSSWLISKKGGLPYKSAVAMKHLDLSGFTLLDVKKAYGLKE